MRYIVLIFCFLVLSSFTTNSLVVSESVDDRELWELNPKEFFQNKTVKQEIDLTNPDDYLLSIAVFQATNYLRDQKNLKRFTPNLVLHNAGKNHIQEMRRHHFFGHVNHYNNNEKTLDKRIKNEGGDFHLMAENLALLSSFNAKGNQYQFKKIGNRYRFYDTNGRKIKPHTYETFAKEVVYEWYKSKGHRHNLFNPELSHIGIAVYIEPFDYMSYELPDVYAVQEFGGY